MISISSTLASGHDFHCHLDLYQSHGKVRQDIEHHRILTVAMTTTPRAFLKNVELFGASQFITIGLGLHPELAATREADFSRFATLISEARVIGEIGLDGRLQHRATLPIQEALLLKVLSAVRRGPARLISFHSPQAVTKVLDAIEAHVAESVHTKILHWFTGTAKEARRAVDLGCYFSINAAMLSNKIGIERVSLIPTSRILTETDGPLIRNGLVPTFPSAVLDLRVQLARLWGIEVSVAQSRLAENAWGALAPLRDVEQGARP